MVKCLCVCVSVTDDEEMEGVESFKIEVNTTDPCVNIVQGSATVLIADNDQSNPQMRPSQSGEVEDDGNCH